MPKAHRLPTVSRRFWLHGDVAADGRAYCAICRRFELPLHFDQHGALNAEHHQQSLAALDALGRVARVIRGTRANVIAILIDRARQ
jgi:hypothetical protein